MGLWAGGPEFGRRHGRRGLPEEGGAQVGRGHGPADGAPEAVLHAARHRRHLRRGGHARPLHHVPRAEEEVLQAHPERLLGAAARQLQDRGQALGGGVELTWSEIKTIKIVKSVSKIEYLQVFTWV